MGFYQFRQKQLIPAGLDQVWSFISNPANLGKITPADMDFTITSESKGEMYPGQIISYKVKPLFNISTTWVTEITHVKEKHYFVDEQRIGPYQMWHHEHFLREVSEGVEMMDIISYQPPLGFLGALANRLIIKKKLAKIFAYRKAALETMFGKPDV
ncbi:SRPBCC family protein [Maribellus sp. CM-23]|uniref:SRPBCC family protein n=1 Tax=Maribellus sp. CM-23 TaxID=2781026 RepID=UPI001F3EF3A8|nr:SRPBCC family protein [Maribellus sp. CM-23]MCE4565621.1 SRPBCC family protein [Maribellus sp. CM-23]